MEAVSNADRLAARRTIALALSTVAWVATLALAQFGPAWIWAGERSLSWAAVAVNVAAGVIWIVVHIRYLRAVGELQRKVLLEAMALALGVGFVATMALTAARSAHLIGLEIDIAVFAVIMAVVYAAATVIGNLRYR